MSRFRTIVPLTALLVAPPAVGQQRPAAAATPAHERIEIRGAFVPGELPFLLVSPARVDAIPFPGAELGLSLDPASTTTIPLATGGSVRVQLTVPAAVESADASVFAQVVSVSPTGVRVLPPFALWRRGAVELQPLVVAPDAPVHDHPDLAGDDTGPRARAERTRGIAVSRSPAQKLTVFRVDGRPLTGRPHDEVAGWMPRDPGPIELFEPEMSGLSLVTDPAAYPYCVHGRISTTWPNNTSTSGSGVLVDAKHVLTCGHMVYNGSRGGWASSIEFVPAYDNGAEPYGAATSFSGRGWRHSWTGWTQDGDYTHDIALFEIDRPVGALTGWHGYGYNTSCSFYKNTTFYGRGYPGEIFSGQLMYKRSGDFDSCPTSRESRFKKETYGGESGAGFYYLNGGNRYVHNVHSHEHDDSGPKEKSDNIRLTETKFGHVVDWIRDARPNSFDLVPMDMTFTGVAGTPRVSPGDRLPAMSFLLHNYSEGDFNGSPQWSVRLSTDKTITASDREAGTRSLSWTSIGDMSSRRINMSNSPPFVPSDLAPGTYYVGLIMTTVDADSGNQATLADDVVRVIVD